jgi:hypothetical protein
MGATVKRNNTAVVARYAKQQRIQSVKDSAYLTFHWYCKNKKKDTYIYVTKEEYARTVSI